eukprot:3129637-Pyramimonas_sp.AAC.1
MVLLERPRVQRRPITMGVPACDDRPVATQPREASCWARSPIATYVDVVRFISQAAGRNETVLGAWGINIVRESRPLQRLPASCDGAPWGAQAWMNPGGPLSHRAVPLHIRACGSER